MEYSKLALRFFKAHNFSRLTKFVRNSSRLNVVSTNKENLILKVGQNTEQFPLVWLRDNCTCKKCFHQDSNSRIIDWKKFNVNIGVKKVWENVETGDIEIEWDDNHTSLFSVKWLEERTFTKKNQKQSIRNCLYRPTRTLWKGSDFSSIIKKYDYEDVMNNDTSLCNWIRDLAVNGAVFLENATLDKKANKRLANKIAFVRKTHYEEEFRVIAKPGTSNVAYLAGALQLHTDLPYYEYIPGVINLHCITQTDGQGGDSLLCDGFYIAEKLRREHKSAFDILSTVQVNWLDIGEDSGKKFYSDFRSPMINLDMHGNIEKIRHSIPQRDSYFNVDIHKVKPWYEALKIFVGMLHSYSCKFKLKPGEMLAFDNTRMVHGREGYTDSASNQRFVIGLYMDWDELYSKLRVIQHTAKS